MLTEPSEVRGTSNTAADLIVMPSDEHHLAEAFERGEISAFEYADGHIYPANLEIPPPTKQPTPPRIH